MHLQTTIKWKYENIKSGNLNKKNLFPELHTEICTYWWH